MVDRAQIPKSPGANLGELFGSAVTDGGGNSYSRSSPEGPSHRFRGRRAACDTGKTVADYTRHKVGGLLFNELNITFYGLFQIFMDNLIFP